MVWFYLKQTNLHAEAKDDQELEDGLPPPSTILSEEDAGLSSRDSRFSGFSLNAPSALMGERMSISFSSTMSADSVKFALQSQTRIRDESEVFTGVLIFITVMVASSCGLAAWVLHLAVRYAGCLGGVNGCHDHILVDILKPLGVGTSLFFIVFSGLSGLCCSLILYSPFRGGIARRCRGGGSADTKIVISSGQTVSVWVAILRILFAAVYCGGGNPLGTEGPIIHLSSSLATWLVSRTGRKRKKFLSTFGVIGATAGISAGFNVLVTGFVYVIEELTRTLSRKLALILAFAAGVAVLVKDSLEKFLENWWHQGHAHLMPDHKTWAKLTDADIYVALVLCVPIGVLTGVAGFIFCHCAWSLSGLLDRIAKHKRVFGYPILPARSHLAIIGVLCGCLGAVGYEVTGINAVWGTTIDAIPSVIHEHLSWQHGLLLFTMKFIAFILATAGGGPGGLLVPSLVTGGLLGFTVGRFVDGDETLLAACSVIGMGAMFASVMHLPVTGVIIIFELTRADKLILHIVLASFISSNVVARLPHGSHSFVHRQLAHNPLWLKLEKRDFIETDAHEIEADVAMFKSTYAVWLWTDHERLRHYFDQWYNGVKGNLLRQKTVNLEEVEGESNGGDSSLKSPKSDFRAAPWSPRSHSSKGGSTSKPGREISSGSLPTHGIFSPRSNTSNRTQKSQRELDRSEKELRLENYNRWMKVATVIPGLNWRIWKTLSEHQVRTLAQAAEVAAFANEVSKDAPSRNISKDTFSLYREGITPPFLSEKGSVSVSPETSPKGTPSIIREAAELVSSQLVAMQNGAGDVQWTESTNCNPHIVSGFANEKEAAFVPDSINYAPTVGFRQML